MGRGEGVQKRTRKEKKVGEAHCILRWHREFWRPPTGRRNHPFCSACLAQYPSFYFSSMMSTRAWENGLMYILFDLAGCAFSRSSASPKEPRKKLPRAYLYIYLCLPTASSAQVNSAERIHSHLTHSYRAYWRTGTYIFFFCSDAYASGSNHSQRL
jgi:hypothetical protein